jgi:hypothetical protein
MNDGLAKDRVRREAPALVSLLDELKTLKASAEEATVAWRELLELADPRVGAKEASEILGVLGPNLYAELKSEEARELFGDAEAEMPKDGWVPVAGRTAAGGRMYRVGDIEALAAARHRGGGRRSKRKQRPVIES